MIFLCDVNTNIEFRRGRKRGSRNKNSKSYDHYHERLDKHLKTLNSATKTGKNISSEVRSWLRLLQG